MTRLPVARRCAAACAALFIANLVLVPTLGAERIRFKDGQVQRGRVLYRTATEVLVELDFGTVSFAPGEILAIEPDEPAAATPAVIPADPSKAEPPAKPAEIPDPKTFAVTSGATAPAPTTLPQALKAVAFIASLSADGKASVGSGVVINDGGAIVTNNHVVAGATKIGVLLPGDVRTGAGGQPKPYEARVIKTDPCFDLALINIPRRTPDYLRFTEDDAVQVGASVRAIGNPQGLSVSVSEGIVSAVRTLKDLTLGQGLNQVSIPGCESLSNRALEGVTWIQTDAAINPGNSGGPLLNERLEIVGINTMIFTTSGGSQGLGFALHVKHARRFAGGYTKKRSRPPREAAAPAAAPSQPAE